MGSGAGRQISSILLPAYTIRAMSTSYCPSKSPALHLARQLSLPDRQATLRRDGAVHKFWNEHRTLLEQAWKEWDETPESKTLPALDESVIHPDLRSAFHAAWENPSEDAESKIRNLWEEVHPGVYKCQFLDPDRIADLRAYFMVESGIPVRAPYGIVHNRNGCMLDPRSEGYLALPAFQKFYREVLIDTYVRPLAYLFFGDYIQKQDASESFGFSIHYSPETEQGIRWHSDASAMTFNVNMDPPSSSNSNSAWAGSSLIFADRSTGKETEVNFQAGVAVIHRGAIPHTALPITEGERSNLVLWVMGKGGRQAFMPYENQMDPKERWSKPVLTEDEEPDMWAPF